MGEIVELDARRPVEDGPDSSSDDRSLSGPARCIACSHEWVACAPAGCIDLECPNCGLRRGFFRYPMAAVEGSVVYVCGCGSEAFYFKMEPAGTPQITCVGCGLVHEVDLVFPSAPRQRGR